MTISSGFTFLFSTVERIESSYKIEKRMGHTITITRGAEDIFEIAWKFHYPGITLVHSVGPAYLG
jgi:hypothetical protein